MEKSPWETNKSSASQEIPKFYTRRRFITAFTSARQLSLTWPTTIQSKTPHLTSCRCILIFSSHLCVRIPSGLVPSGPPPNTCVYLSCPPYVPHVQPNSYFLIWSPEWYWVSSTLPNASRFVVFSSPLSRRPRTRTVVWKIQSYTSGAAITKLTLLYRQSHLYRLFCGATAKIGPRRPRGWGFEITHRHTARGRIPLFEWSARCRVLYLTTHNTHNRQTSIVQSSTWQHTTLTTDRHPCPRRDSNPQSHQGTFRRPTS